MSKQQETRYAYLDLGNRRIDEYAIEADGVLRDGTSTVNIETARKYLVDALAYGYEDAKIVRVVTFTQDVEEQPTNGE